jgi:hypothetical protein
MIPSSQFPITLKLHELAGLKISPLHLMGTPWDARLKGNT